MRTDLIDVRFREELSDTLVAWDLYYAGYTQFDIPMIMPRIVFNMFPYFNDMLGEDKDFVL